jgi:hypothetical protein
MSKLYIAGIVFTGMGLLALLIDDSWRALGHPFDFRGKTENVEPIKRVAFHLVYILGLTCLCAWFMWRIISYVS